MPKPILWFAHCRNFANSGDMASCPYWPLRDYFRENFDRRFIDISDKLPYEGDKVSDNDFLIVGGGGLDGYHDVWHKRINTMAKKAKKAVLWGVGSNRDPKRQLKALNQIDQSLFCLVGLRDFGYKYVPCSSCLNIEEDVFKIEASKNCGLVHHLDASFNCSEVPANCDVICNSQSYERIFTFIREHRFIITDSFHICYWSQLLERPVYRLHSNGTDSRFIGMKYQVPNWTGSRNSEAEKVYPGFWKECVEINLSFFEKVKKEFASA